MSLREDCARVASACLEALIVGEKGHECERARSKLLFLPPPRGVSWRGELARRLDLVRQGDWSELLVRVEEQCRCRAQLSRRSRVATQDFGRRAARAKQLAREGAFSKAVAAVSTEVASFPPATQHRWASTLLPRSARAASPAAAPDLADAQPLAPLADEAAAMDCEPLAGQAAADAGVQGAAPATPPAAPTACEPTPTRPEEHRAKSISASALGGVHFRAMSGPGPSGARPEHLREMLSVRRRAVVNRLLRKISELVERASSGALPDSARWLLDSRLVFLRKPGKEEPRPIRIGELWRRLVAKRQLHEHRGVIQRRCISARQFGIALPGGAEALIHARIAIEAAVSGDATVGPLVALDLDLRNAFPRFEWDSIQAAVDEDVPGLTSWLRWAFAEPVRVLLPSGDFILADRGAEQGDPLGGVECALVLARVAAIARRVVEDAGGWLWEGWYMEDGQVVLPCRFADMYLKAFDEAAAAVGATRGEAPDAKSVARLIGDATACSTVGDVWCSAYIRKTCKCPPPGAGAHVLGVETAPHAARELFQSASDSAETARKGILSIGSAPEELALLRTCADACKVQHLLRALGPEVPEDCLLEFDSMSDVALQTVLGGPLSAAALGRSAAGVADGGLGVRRAADLAAPAFIASRVESRPLIAHLMSPSGSKASLGAATLASAVLAHLDASTAAAVDAWYGVLPEGGATAAGLLIEAASDKAADDVAQLIAGSQPRRGAEPTETREQALISPAAAGDTEHPDAPQRLQHQLSALVDASRIDEISNSLRDSGDWSGLNLLADLRHRANDHSWLWALNPAEGVVLPPVDFVEAVRVRVGADLASGELECACCGAPMQPHCRHALCCAPGASTTGHNRARDAVFALASLADGASRLEVRGLASSRPGLRPADILTSAAVPGSLAALDVGVACPDAEGAGDDACEAMRSDKKKKYASILSDLAEEGVVYCPLVVSCYGRLHVDALQYLRSMAAVAARRHGFADGASLLRRVRTALGVQVWRRVAAMARACRGSLSAAEAARLLAGAQGRR